MAFAERENLLYFGFSSLCPRIQTRYGIHPVVSPGPGLSSCHPVPALTACHAILTPLAVCSTPAPTGTLHFACTTHSKAHPESSRKSNKSTVVTTTSDDYNILEVPDHCAGGERRDLAGDGGGGGDDGFGGGYDGGGGGGCDGVRKNYTNLPSTPGDFASMGGKEQQQHPASETTVP
ncbi:class E basic helix-loop-helix protein 22-like [Wyeomyia smithii]|uniref:class E basic helix-loop-helix protein 22-like n=1 Tax=Wyeomyia smithii TaxID=174621 RepID=UPI002467B2CD|nr:class E basic helix-loop-helix protein 22-like [Wyeomyia smithii]